jgi:hypothetical protein
MKMNQRQANKLAAQRIPQMEWVLYKNKVDITNYNLCILHQIDGGSPCIFCEDYEECQLEAKNGRGCREWMLKSQTKAGEQQDAQRQEEGTDIGPVQCVEEQ